MLRCVRSARLRWAVAASVIGLAASLVTAGEAEARGKRQHRKSAVARSGGYAPPFSSYVVDANTGRAMQANAENELRHPASITKVMTLYMLFEQLEKGSVALDTELKVSARAASMAPSKIGLRPGETIEVEDAIKALVTKSANDAACTIAENLAGTEDDFAERMTRKARSLGMTRTVFKNASGLPDDEQVTTARDLTILGRAIQERFPRYYRYFQTRSFNYAGRTIGNHNRLIGKVEGVDGIKTGFTNKSGFNLLTSARINGRHVVAAVLGGRSGASRDAIMAGLIRQNLAKASTGPATTAVASADRPERSERPVETARARSASPQEIEDASETTASVKAGRPLDLAAARAGTQPARIAPLPPVEPVRFGGKIDGRLPVLAAVPAPPEKPTRAEFASAKLAPVPEPRPIQEARRETAAKPATLTPWVIQLAAEGDEKQARAVLDDAKSRSGRLLAKAAPFTEKVNRGGSTLYRARFSGFSEADTAQDACRALKKSGFACFATRS